MSHKNLFRNIKLTKGLLSLIAILLAFVLILVFIWLWYSIKMTSLDKEEKNSGNTSIQSKH